LLANLFFFSLSATSLPPSSIRFRTIAAVHGNFGLCFDFFFSSFLLLSLILVVEFFLKKKRTGYTNDFLHADLVCFPNLNFRIFWINGPCSLCKFVTTIDDKGTMYIVFFFNSFWWTYYFVQLYDILYK